MAYATTVVANSFLKLSFEAKQPIRLLQLQRMLYLTATLQGRRKGEEIFNEEFACFPYGPALWSIHYKFEAAQSEPLKVYAKDAGGAAHALAVHEPLWSTIKEVWNSTYNLTPAQLARATRTEASAWSKAVLAGEQRIGFELLKSDLGYQELLQFP